MYAAFVRLLNMSAASGILIAVIIALRFLLRKVPKKYICILWAIAALRLVCPYSISSAVSAYNYIDNATYGNGQIAFIQYNEKTEKPMGQLPAFTQIAAAADGPVATVHRPDFYLPTTMGIWAAGAGALALYALWSYWHIRRTLREAVQLKKNIYLCDRLPSPFVLGILKPRIYLPSELTEAQRHSVISHERAHIARLDHWWKPIGYAILCVHWFNPLVWLGYGLLCRDLEMACDEKVIQAMTPVEKKEYASVLLSCSMPRKFITACPLAFGETGVKQRIRGILNYRKPAFWVVLVAVLLCAAVAAAFLTNPTDTQADNPFSLTIGAEQVYSIQLTTPNGSGGCSHADNSPYTIGEQVVLEPMADLKSLTGVTVTALGQDGTVLWAFSVPEDMEQLTSVDDGLWSLRYAPNDSGSMTQLHFGPISIRSGALAYEVPKGIAERIDYSYRDGQLLPTHTFLADGAVIGGTYAFPMESKPDGMEWIKNLDLPEWKMEDVGYFADNAGDGIWSIEFFSDVPPGVERTVLNQHQFYFHNGYASEENYIYDIWFDTLRADPKIRSDIENTVYLSSVMQDQAYPEPSRTFVIGNLPEGYSRLDGANGSILFTSGGTIVGGIDAYPIPLNTYDPEDTHMAWLERAGISDFGNPDLYYEGGMTFFPNQWSAYFTGESPRTERHHQFRIAGNFIYDIWLDGLSVDDSTQQQIYSACQNKAAGILPDEEHTIHSLFDAEEEAYQTITAFMQGLQENQSAAIMEDRQPIGAEAPAARIAEYYYAGGDQYIRLEEIPAPGKEKVTAVVMVEGSHYSGEGQADEITWKETRGEIPSSWIGSIEWNRQTFQYIDTLKDTNGTTYLYHTDLWFMDDPGGYFIDFHFTPEGEFSAVQFRVNMYEANDYTVTETILYTDPQMIHDIIMRKYQEATATAQ